MRLILYNKLTIFLAVWFIVAVGFFFFREGTTFVWNDTFDLTQFRFHDIPSLKWQDPSVVFQALSLAFEKITYRGYRPLASFIDYLGVAYFGSSARPSYGLWVGLVSILVGMTAGCFFLVAHRLSSSYIAALLASFLFLFSTPTITMSLPVIGGLQVFVPLWISLGLLAYWKMTEQESLRRVWFGVLCLILLTGPWIREFIGLLNLLIIFLEWQRLKRLSLTMLVMVLFLLHAIFPTAIVKIIFFQQLPFSSIFSMGALSGRVVLKLNALVGMVLQNTKTVVLSFLSVQPPILWGLIFLSLLFMIYKLFRKNTPEILRITNGTFLVIWFTLAFLPFLKVYTSPGHFMYALMPFSILSAILLYSLWKELKQLKGAARIARYVFLLLVIIIVVDNMLNLAGSYKVIRSINEGSGKVAQWLRTNIPYNSLVIANALHAEEIRLQSDNHFTTYWTVVAGIPVDRTVETHQRLNKLINDNYTQRNIYFLDVNYNFTPEKGNYHAHKYVRDGSVPMEYLGLIYTTKVQYPFCDPFKVFVPRSFVSFLGAPDLENDFYHGPAQNSKPLTREVYAEYHVYKVAGKKVSVCNVAYFSCKERNQTDVDTAIRRGGNLFWEESGPFPHWLQAEMDENCRSAIKSYALKTGSHGDDSISRMPKAWKLLGSNDSISWEELDVRDNEVNWHENELRMYSVNTAGTYRYYRLHVDCGNHPNIVRVYIWQLYPFIASK